MININSPSVFLIYLIPITLSSLMLLQQCSQRKQALSKQQATNNQNKNNGKIWEEFTFSDSFIRKHPKKDEFPVSRHFQDDIQKNKKQWHSRELISQNDESREEQQKCRQANIFCLPNKRAFQIKFLQSKHKKYDQLQSDLKKQGSPKFKIKKELILSRRNDPKPIYTSRNSTRYSIQNNNRHSNKTTARYYNEFSQDEQNLSSLKISKRTQRKSIEICKNLPQSPNIFQSVEMSLINAYKVKSLVLGKNPKEQRIQKSKKVIGRNYEKKHSCKKINSSRARSEKGSQKKIEASFKQMSRKRTKYQRNNLNLDKSSQPAKQKNRKSAKLNSILQKLESDFHKQEVIFEPWNQDINFQPWSKEIEMEIFDENFQGTDFNFKNNQPNSLYFKDSELVNVETKPGSRKNCFRKIYTTKQNVKLKRTILSQK